MLGEVFKSASLAPAPPHRAALRGALWSAAGAWMGKAAWEDRQRMRGLLLKRQQELEQREWPFEDKGACERPPAACCLRAAACRSLPAAAACRLLPACSAKSCPSPTACCKTARVTYIYAHNKPTGHLGIPADQVLQQLNREMLMKLLK